MTDHPGPPPEERPEGAPETGPGVTFNPQSAQYPAGSPYYAPAPGGQYGQQPWGAHPGQQPWGQPGAPRHGRAGTALALGLIAVVGTLFSCGLSLLLSPAAWILGQTALRDIRASPGRWSGDGDAKAGMILGIVGTVLLVLAVIAAAAFFVWIGVGVDTPQDGTGTSV